MTHIMRTCISLLLIFLTVVTPAYAGWVDDWLDQHTSSSAGYFEGQQRNYYSAGTFSGRMHTGNTYPISITPPRIRAGCGGIDVFLGSMSYVNFEYLVQKMQTIMQNAPIVAFELGLSVLSEKMKNTINSVEDFLNALNNIQINDCKATKAVVAQIAHTASDGQIGEPAIERLITSGTSEMWKKAKEVVKSAQGDLSQIQIGGGPKTASEELTEGCPQELRDIFQSGSLLENIGAKLNIPSTYTDLIRGLAGDIDISNQNGIPVGKVIPSCPENNNFTIESFVAGNIFTRDTAGNCNQITDMNADIRNYVETKLNNVMSSIQLHSSMSSDDKAFLDSVPLPIYVALKDIVGTGEESAIMFLLVEATSKAYSFRMLADIYKLLLNILEQGLYVSSASRGAVSGQDADKCMINIYKLEFDDKIKEMKEYTYKLNSATREAYAKTAQEVNNIYTLVQKLRDTGSVVRMIVASRYGEQVASRAGGSSSEEE